MDILSFDSFKFLQEKLMFQPRLEVRKTSSLFPGCEKQGEEVLLYPESAAESAGQAPGITLI
jgi:hypothetical protein